MALGDWAKPLDRILQWLLGDRKKTLPASQVVIDTYTEGDLSVDIRANILLNEDSMPDPELFLDRVQLRAPYCTRCRRELDEWRASAWADGGQMGYRCPRCSTKIRLYKADLVRDVKAKIRLDFPQYWNRYREAILHMTGGRPKRYKLPD